MRRSLRNNSSKQNEEVQSKKSRSALQNMTNKKAKEVGRKSINILTSSIISVSKNKQISDVNKNDGYYNKDNREQLADTQEYHQAINSITKYTFQDKSKENHKMEKNREQQGKEQCEKEQELILRREQEERKRQEEELREQEERELINEEGRRQRELEKREQERRQREAEDDRERKLRDKQRRENLMKFLDLKRQEREGDRRNYENRTREHRSERRGLNAEEEQEEEWDQMQRNYEYSSGQTNDEWNSRVSEKRSSQKNEERNLRYSEERNCEEIEERHSRENEERSLQESDEEQPQEVLRELEDEIKRLDAEEQLYGAGDNMVSLTQGIFCKRRVLQSALGSAKKSTHVVRRLIRGVFTDEAIVNCTATGRIATVGMNSRKSMEQIHMKAKEAIINCAKFIGKRKDWPIQSDKELESAFASGLTVAKREIRSEKEQQGVL